MNGTDSAANPGISGILAIKKNSAAKMYPAHILGNLMSPSDRGLGAASERSRRGLPFSIYSTPWLPGPVKAHGKGFLITSIKELSFLERNEYVYEY
ncbi:MAG TPA: hypothetical protein PKZ41_00495 [Candidatus Omnitrophota bacterium]|nr:hypothetical protein [Candidatus Omnitrophota bacterium]